MKETIAASVERFRRRDYVKITIYSLALSALWGSLHSIVLPLRLLDFVAGPLKNTYLGLLTLAGLLLAMLVQPIAGAISDRSGFHWGRRRPFILIGSIAALLLLPGIGLAGGYAAIFVIYCLMQVSSNVAQGPYQGFIPDLVPENKRGIASGMKSLFEITGGFGLVYLIVYAGNYLSGEGSPWLWTVLGILAGLLLATMLITIITVKEKPATAMPEGNPLSAFYRSFRIDLRKSPGFIYYLASRLLLVMALTTLQSFAFYFVQDVVRASDTATTTTALLAAVGAGMIISVYPAGRLSDRLGRRPVLAASGLLGALGILVLFFAPYSPYILFGGAILGVAGGTFLSSSWALATDLVPKSEEARYLGLANLATAGGAALARLIGPAIDFFNSLRAGSGYQFMLLACFIYFVAGSALIAKVKERS